MLLSTHSPWFQNISLVRAIPGIGGPEGRWLEACLQEELPAATVIENELRNGVIIAKLAHFFAPKAVAIKNIYDADLAIYKVGVTTRTRR